MSTLKTVVEQIKSDRSKDRQQGLASLQEVFGRPSVVEKFDQGDGKNWLVVFQALFKAVLRECEGATKKGGSVAAAERRLKDAAATVRWLTEKTVTKWASKVVKPLVNHLLQRMVYRDRLLAPIALDYVKALRVLCSYPPHRDHLMMAPDDWLPILSLSFAVVLDDDLNSTLEDNPDVSSEAEVDFALSEDDGTPARKRRKLGAPNVDGKGPRSQIPRTASPEQIEFVALIATLLRSPRMQLLGTGHKYLAGAVLRRLARFFKLYHAETSAHLDAIEAVQAVLDAVALNARDETTNFGVAVWGYLLRLWPSKNRPLKEGVLMVLTVLFPYVAHTDSCRFDKTDGFGRLLRHLQADIASRWGFEELNLDCLRLEITSEDNEPFVARTLRAGFNFSPGQATSWAYLELMADAIRELYLLSESTSSSVVDGRRSRLENPIKALLQSIQLPKTSRGVVYALQTLAFVAERHWPILHSEFQLEVLDCLLHTISSDDATVQSWTFCCIATIAYADSAKGTGPEDEFTSRWDAVWSHSMRRSNVPSVCRSACHAAHVLLALNKVQMTRVLAEVETMAQDINVQGPAAPCDSVCSFLGKCVKIANQDTRLHRMHLDDKVLSWLIENWNVLGGVSRSASSLHLLRLEQHTMQDILSLLESACGMSHSNQLFCPILLPQHAIVNLIRSQINTALIREFLLDAQFADEQSYSQTVARQSSRLHSENHRGDLTQPNARVRKASAFFLKTLEAIIPSWDEGSDTTLRPPVENARRTLDFAVLAICFESCLTINGVANNRRTLLAACKLISLLSPHIVDLGWSMDEISILLSGFSPLISEAFGDASDTKWEAFISAGPATGIGHTLKKHIGDSSAQPRQAASRHLQFSIWRSSDVQDAVSSVLASIKRILKAFAFDDETTADKRLSPVMNDENDGFGPTRAANVPILDANSGKDDQGALRRVIRMCVDALALAPVFRSSDGQVTKDKTLIEIACKCDDVEKFQVIVEPCLHHFQQQHIRLSPQNVDELLSYVEEPLRSYNHSFSDTFHALVIRLLDATSCIWLASSCPPETTRKACELILWLSGILKRGKLCSWRIRDLLCRFLDRYLTLDPSQGILEGLEPEETPDSLLPFLTKDEDIRVRFTAALSCARLFSTEYIRTKDPMTVYTTIREQLCIELDNYEHMLTRFISLANIMIASSAVRRGPYWHLLETCLYDLAYSKHIESVLRKAAYKMGLSRFLDLFESYASQIAFSVRRSQKDFFSIPPRLLGYRDRKECAEATFAAFGPTNILASEDDADPLHEHGPFLRHCRVLELRPEDALLMCFADIVGYQIVFWIEDHLPDSQEDLNNETEIAKMDVSGVFATLEATFVRMGSAEFLRKQIAQSIDSIVCSILRTNGEHDYRRDGAIVNTFGMFGKPERSVRAFRSLMQFRGQADFEMHSPTLPAFSAPVVLSALDWLFSQVETANSAATTYHVLHYFFAAIADTPIINEQLRLLTCLCIWISLAYAHFKNATLLRVLMSGATSLLSQLELSSIAQGMLDWAFIHLRETQRDTPHVVDILVQICSICQEFMETQDDSIRKTGSRLKGWLEDEIVSLAEVEVLRKRVAVALTTWPGELDDQLLTIRGSLDWDELSNILDDPYLSHHKFKIVRRLAEFAKSSSYDTGRFAGHDFWRLKDSIPVADLDQNEIDAFISLLIANSGHICSQTVDQTYGRTIATRQVSLGMSKDMLTEKRPIIQALLDQLTDQNPRIVQIAYRTLRKLAGNGSLDSPDYGSWPAEYRGDISCLDFCPVIETGASSQDLAGILGSHFVEVASSFETWVSGVTSFLARVLATRDKFYARLSDALGVNVDFATQMFPVLIHTVLLTIQKTKSGHASREILSEYLTRLLDHSEIDIKCHRSVVGLILHLRHFDCGVAGDELAYNRWLEVDFMQLSRSAITCGAYTTALLFLELAAEYKQAPDVSDKLSEQILYDIYSHMDEPDGFYGIKTLDLQGFLVRRFHHEKQWDKAFQFHGAEFEAGGGGGPIGTMGIVESLRSFGFNKLAMSTLHSTESVSSRSGDMEYRLGWRTETWDLPEPQHENTSGIMLYNALRAVHRERDSVVVDNVVSKALSMELRRLRYLGNENLVEIRQVTQNVMCLAQIRYWRNVMVQNNLSGSPVNMNDGAWKEFLLVEKDFDFSDLESIVATRISLLRSARQKEQKDQIGNMQSDLTGALLEVERKCLLQLSEAARGANQTQVALNSVLCALQNEVNPGFEVQQEFANVLWLQREQKFAVDRLKAEVQRRRRQKLIQPDEQRKVQDALALAKLGEWTSEACLEKPASIHTQYFLPAINLLVDGRKESLPTGDVRAAVFHKCALFAEQQYHALMTSEEIRRLQVYQERKTQEISQRKELMETASTKRLQQELSLHQRKAEALYAQDTAQLNEFIGARDNFLRQAIEMLSLCLQASDSYDIDAVIRLCSLWFANFKSDVSLVQGTINWIPSRKFVFLAHQLSARLSASDMSDAANQKTLQSLLLRMCAEHPFHSLYQVYSLQSSHGDTLSNRRRSSIILPEDSQADRAEAAFGLFERLLSSPKSSPTTGDMRKLCNAYLEWAKYPIKNDQAILDRKGKKGAPADKLRIPGKLAILRIKDLRVPVTTANTPLDPSMRYQDCVWIHGYQETYDIAGGINLPKICYCIGSDGLKYKQLFKGEGNDDMRQDAVMEQVFELCNQVLVQDQQTRKRELSIRSYKVVPLAPQAGLLEFVGNTRPLQFLVAAHERYNKKDLTSRECHERLVARRREAQKETDGAKFKKAMVEEFLQIRQRFRPVMRHFFTECRKEPQAWFEMRLKYSRSVAVTSIVGHILGLGDRHLSNILIDTVTGEVVHIDLGIAFEQGKLLPIPERVPFRLTADMIDGFGMSGTDGVFRRCAEETLRVLRDGSSVIKTVLEVFKYDPLHSWTMSAMKIRKAQAGTGSTTSNGGNHNQNDSAAPGLGIGIDLNSGVEDESADRALSSVAKKLDKSLSVEYTVNELIAEATDMTNLALMFVGWSPHC